MKKNILFILFAIAICIRSNADGSYNIRLIFSLNKTRNSAGLHHTITLPDDGWIHTSSLVNNHWFDAFVFDNFTNLPNIVYAGNWPSPEALDFGDGYKPMLNHKIVCQWDEVENTPITTNMVVNGYLLDTPDFDNENDEDVYEFVPSCKNYCIELSTSSDVKISMFTFPETYSEITFSTTNCKFEQSTHAVKRFYKNDWIVDKTYYIKVHGLYNTPTYNGNKHHYKFVIKNVRPVVLVHGLSEGPTNHIDVATSFGDIKNDLDMMAGMQPMKIFDFPWNSTEGSYQQYCIGTNSIYACVQNCTNFFLKPLVITHSFGSMLVLQQIINNANFLPLLGKFIFLAPNFGGSDHDVSMLTKFFPDASQENLYSMRNGTEHIWLLLKDIPQAFFNLPASYVIGLDDMSIGVSDSDGVVTVSSASLPNTMNKAGDYIYLNLNNKNISDLSFPVPADSEYKSILDLIKEHAKD